MPSEQEDRALLERVWMRLHMSFGWFAIGHGANSQIFTSLASAAAYTREALAKVAEIEEELVFTQIACIEAAYPKVAQRILAREHAALAEAREGMKEGA